MSIPVFFSISETWIQTLIIDYAGEVHQSRAAASLNYRIRLINQVKHFLLDNGLISNYIIVMETKLIINQIGRIRDKAHAFLLNQLKEHRMKGIAPTHGDILWALLAQGELSMKDLAENIHRDKSTVTALVNKLIKYGYVTKRTDENDSRVNLISLTPKGLELKDKVMTISTSLQEKAYKGLSEKEKKVLMKLLDKIYQNF